MVIGKLVCQWRARRCAHGCEVGADVDAVGDKKQADKQENQWLRPDRPHIDGKPRARNPSDPCTHELDRGHQRVGQQHGPQHVEAKLGSGLRIGGNAARVIVRCPGNQAGTKFLEDGA